LAAKRNTRNDKPSRSLPWGPMILSFAVGAFVMFLLHLKDNVPEDKVSTSPSKNPQKQDVKKPAEPKFDFYTLLPEMEVVVDKKNVPEKPVATSPPETVKPSTNTTEPEPQTNFMLQVGSFRKMSDADGFRAKLALLGIESKVQSVTIDNKDTWHRVQVGPIVGRNKADAMQKQLRENDIDSLLLKSKT